MLRAITLSLFFNSGGKDETDKKPDLLEKVKLNSTYKVIGKVTSPVAFFIQINCQIKCNAYSSYKISSGVLKPIHLRGLVFSLFTFSSMHDSVTSERSMPLG